jgi:nitrilase
MGLTEFDKLEHGERDHEGPIQAFLSKCAKRLDVWIVGGTVPMKASTDNKIIAACMVYNDQGERVARYDKIHLFDVDLPDSEEQYRESDTIEAGHTPVVLDTPFGRLGLVICYDLRFPEIFREMLDQGMELVTVPSAFTAKTGAAHWELLLRARAVENLCYVIAPDQGGFHVNGRQTYGDSMIVDPWGNVLARLPTGSGFVQARIDMDQLHKVRESFPVLNHRRLK